MRSAKVKAMEKNLHSDGCTHPQMIRCVRVGGRYRVDKPKEGLFHERRDHQEVKDNRQEKASKKISSYETESGGVPASL